MALSTVGEVHSPVFLMLFVLRAVVERHGVVVDRIFEFFVPVVSDVADPCQPLSTCGESRDGDQVAPSAVSGFSVSTLCSTNCVVLDTLVSKQK